MKHFKKRTLALVLASVVTVVGAFGADSYKNSLMGLSFETSASGDVKMVVQTKIAYSGNVNPIKKDANTYVLMLPEMNSLASTPDLTNVGNVSSVNIRTMPYSNNAKGYTRITVRTVTPSVALTGQNQIYIATAKSNVPSNEIKTPVEKNNTVKRPVQKSILSEKESRSYSSNNAQNKVIRPEVEDVNTNAKTESQKPELEKQDTNSISNNKTISEDTVTKIPETKSEGNSYYFLWALLIVLASAYFYVRAKNKMTEIAGEQLNIDIDDEKEKKPNKKQELSKIKKTIKTLDSAYSKTSGMVNKTTYNVNTPVKTVKPAEELNVVDLDELFKEQSAKTKEEEENIALEDFLSGFYFD